ncbi:enoyl-CoA hydratase/isomerase family protein, partial [Anaerovibrio sp.]|uniref:enoyl-CoA hydratase/isomerase family protein n=1 Tax=Anaerovibrio sp. TaxID=1872532 RepID=UPI003F17E69B
MSTDAVLYREEGAVAIITLNRPQSLNSMSMELVEGVLEALAKGESSQAVRVMVLTGAGRAFSAGGDLPSLDGLHSLAERKAFITKVGSMVQAIHAASKPVIAMVNGVAAGAGFNLAIACDLIYAAEGVRFIQSFVNVGLSPDCGGFFYLAKSIGQARAKELMLTAKPLTAEKARDWGLINDVLPAAELTDKVMQVAVTIAAKAPLAVAKTKEGVNKYGASLEETLAFEAETSAVLLDTEDFREGVTAFKEKR